MTDKEILQNLPFLSISRLMEWGYLKKDNISSFTVKWHHNLGWFESKAIDINLFTYKDPHLVLRYNYGDKPVIYKVNLVPCTSNLGFGLVWYFICPKTNKRCRKLHLKDGYFYHRSAFKNVCYISESCSGEWRDKQKNMLKYKRMEKGFDLIYSKHAKTHYKGQPTKNYLKALRWIEEGKLISEQSLFYF